MTLTVNLHNCAGWAASTAYIVGDRRSNSSAPVKAYQCTTAGTSGVTGPTTTGASISDGGAVWKYLSAVDYTTWTAAIAGLGTLTQASEIVPWNDAEWVMNTVSVSGNGTTAVNTLTIRPATGEGFRDNTNAQTNGFRYNQANGVGVASNSNYTSAFSIDQDYVKVIGIQLKGSGGSNSQPVRNAGSCGLNSVIDSCILDNGSAGNQAYAASLGNTITLKNSLFVVNTAGACVTSSNGFKAYNCTVVRVGATSPTGTAFTHNYGAITLENCAAFGFTTLHTGTGTNVFTTNATDIASPPAGWTGSLTYANQFVNTGSTPANRDFRLKAGANLLDTGTTDTTNIPTALDIVGIARPQGSAWDVGAWEFVVAAANSKPPMNVIFGERALSIPKNLALFAAAAVIINPDATRRGLLGLDRKP